MQRKYDSLITWGGTYDGKENFEALVFETTEWVRYINLHVYIKLFIFFIFLNYRSTTTGAFWWEMTQRRANDEA